MYQVLINSGILLTWDWSADDPPSCFLLLWNVPRLNCAYAPLKHRSSIKPLEKKITYCTFKDQETIIFIIKRHKYLCSLSSRPTARPNGLIFLREPRGIPAKKIQLFFNSTGNAGHYKIVWKF